VFGLLRNSPLNIGVQKRFLKKPKPLVLGFYWVSGFIGFWIFLFELAAGKLVG